MSRTIRKKEPFQYYAEDFHCGFCLHNKTKGKPHGCGRDDCCCDDIRADVLNNGRISRKRGPIKWEA